MKILFLIFFYTFFLNSLNADINQEILDLKNEFKQIKELYEKKIIQNMLLKVMILMQITKIIVKKVILTLKLY